MKNKMFYYCFLNTGTQMPLTGAARVLLAFWLCICVIIIYTFTGTLIASLTVTRIQMKVKSLEDLSKQNEISWTYRANTAHDYLFSVSSNLEYFFLLV